jgi:exodeoxyribonuclease V gamma subunit
MRRNYRPGDRSRREDDRYLFLEALLSAREHLHVSWVGRSVNDNTPRPPSVLVGQLRDHLKAGWRLEGALDDEPEALLDALTVDHRLQPFSAAYFPARAEASKLFTYAKEWDQALPWVDSDALGQDLGALSAEDTSASGDALLPPLERDEPLSVRELADFLKDPVKSFFRQRLRVVFETEDAASENHEPFEVDQLEAWQLQNELIRAQAAALERGEADLLPAALSRLERMHRSGDLAAGGFGEVIAGELMAPMADLFERYRAELVRWPDLLDEQFELRVEGGTGLGTRTIEDWVGELRAGLGETRGRVFLDPGTLIKDRKYRGDRLIAYWVGHLAAQLAAGAVTTVIVSKVGSVEFAPLTADAARGHLLTLLGAWEEGTRRPLPLAVKAAFAWLRKRPGDTHTETDALSAQLTEAREAARLTYDGAGRQPGERDTNAYLYRAYPDFRALAASGEFETLALALLLPLHRAIPAASSRSKSTTPPAGDTQ